MGTEFHNKNTNWLLLRQESYDVMQIFQINEYFSLNKLGLTPKHLYLLFPLFLKFEYFSPMIKFVTSPLKMFAFDLENPPNSVMAHFSNFHHFSLLSAKIKIPFHLCALEELDW